MRQKFKMGDIVVPTYEDDDPNRVSTSFGIVWHCCEEICRIFWPKTGHKQVVQYGYGNIKKLGE